MPVDHPSEMIWCMVRSRMCSVGAGCNRLHLINGAVSSWNGVMASCCVCCLMIVCVSVVSKCCRSMCLMLMVVWGCMSCLGVPLSVGKLVRRVWWRRTISANACSSAFVSSSPLICMAAGMLYVALSPWSWLRNHSLSWAKDRGMWLGLSTGWMGGSCCWVGCCWLRLLCSWATVGFSNICLRGISLLSACLSLDVSWVASRECPPSSKKLWWMLTVWVPRREAKMLAMISSVGVRGAT